MRFQTLVGIGRHWWALETLAGTLVEIGIIFLEWNVFFSMNIFCLNEGKCIHQLFTNIKHSAGLLFPWCESHRHHHKRTGV